MNPWFLCRVRQLLRRILPINLKFRKDKFWMPQRNFRRSTTKKAELIYCFLTRNYSSRRILSPIREKALSKTLLESAAIIAYKQPVTRLDLEEIRGVDSEYAIQTLLKLGIIEVVGRKDAIGRPVLFGTTDEFLKRFQISSLADLPDYDSLLAAINVNKKGDYLFEKDVYDESKDPEFLALQGAAAGGVVFDDGNTQIEIAPDVNHTGNDNSSFSDAEGYSGTDGEISGARGENDGDEDFDLDELDEEMPDFLVGEEVEKID